MTALLFSLTIGCLPTMSASITATITDNNQEIVPNASVEIRAWDGALLEELDCDDDGIFQANLPPYQEFFVIVSSNAHPPTSFTGYSGEGDYTVPNGTLWVRTFDEVNAVVNEFSSCGSNETPETNETSGTGFIEGEAKLYIDGTPVSDLPTLTTATASAEQDETNTYEGCYLPTIDEESGETVESSVTGESGQYAIFDIPEGLTKLTIEIDVDGDLYDYPYWVYVPTDGVVPLRPTLVPFLDLP